MRYSGGLINTKRPMKLINCTDCGHEVSPRATSCPKCGAPIAAESLAAGATLITTQGTSKRLKLQILISTVMFWVGVVWVGYVLLKQDETGMHHVFYGMVLVLVAFVWQIVVRIRAWWHHD